MLMLSSHRIRERGREGERIGDVKESRVAFLCHSITVREHLFSLHRSPSPQRDINSSQLENSHMNLYYCLL